MTGVTFHHSPSGSESLTGERSCTTVSSAKVRTRYEDINLELSRGNLPWSDLLALDRGSRYFVSSRSGTFEPGQLE